MRPLGVELAAMLADRGVDTIFGIPGVHNIELYRGIEDAGIRHVLARHEQGAGFMADGYARATGKPGVAFVISGPGLTNIMTPMGQAYSDSVPLLVISTVLDDTAAKRGQLHQMRDQEGAARTVCDWSETAHSPEAAYSLVDRALNEAANQRPRPSTFPCLSVLSEALQTLSPNLKNRLTQNLHRTDWPSLKSRLCSPMRITPSSFLAEVPQKTRQPLKSLRAFARSFPRRRSPPTQGAVLSRLTRLGISPPIWPTPRASQPSQKQTQ